MSRALRRRYGRSRLTPDVLPYDGYGIQSPDEYKATLSFLQTLRTAEALYGRDPDPSATQRFLDAPIMSNEYRGAMAAIRGGLARQSGYDRTGPFRLTPYGVEYLTQRMAR